MMRTSRIFRCIAVSAMLLCALLPPRALAQEGEQKKKEPPQIPLSLLRLADRGRGGGMHGMDVGYLIQKEESSFAALERLTYEGDNGEAYFDTDARNIIYQSKMPGQEYDQIYVMLRDGSGKRMVSTGKGRTTCSYFLKDGSGFIYASTHLREGPPPAPKETGGYEWQFDDAYDIFLADMNGKILQQLTDTPGYDAECTISPSGKLVLWTSARDGDLDIYCMRVGGKVVTRITNTPGYDGGAFFSPNESKIVYRGSRTGNYKDLQIFVCNPDGSNQQQLTHNSGTNFAPYYYPDGDHIIFSSNMDDPGNFELYMMKADGSDLTRITYAEGFDGFPYFSSNGKYLLFSSNRADPTSRETHVFVADFKPYW